MRIVLFGCVHNAGRSQMAAAFFNAIADPQRARAISAGTQPAAAVHPEVIEAMRDCGIDLSRERPQLLTHELAAGADLLVTMGCGEECPVVPGLRHLDWPLRDPKELDQQGVREVREEVRRLVTELVEREGLAGATPER
jgi:arsenate reductase (thioredoxin)